MYFDQSFFLNADFKPATATQEAFHMDIVLDGGPLTLDRPWRVIRPLPTNTGAVIFNVLSLHNIPSESRGTVPTIVSAMRDDEGFWDAKTVNGEYMILDASEIIGWTEY